MVRKATSDGVELMNELQGGKRKEGRHLIMFSQTLPYRHQKTPRLERMAPEAYGDFPSIPENLKHSSTSYERKMKSAFDLTSN